MKIRTHQETKSPTDQSSNGQEESYTEEADNTVAQAAEQENQDVVQSTEQENQAAVQAADGESLPINSTFEEKYLVYKVTGDKQVTVKELDIAEYWDNYCDVVINPTVEHDGVTYQVVSIEAMAFMDDWKIQSFTF